MAMRGRIVWACALLVTFILSAVSLGGSGAGDEYESGDEWVYDYDVTIDTMLLSGTLTYSFDGESTKSVAGYAYSTYEIGYHGSMTISGTFGGYPVTGTATMRGVDSLDQATLDEIRWDDNFSMTLTVVVYNTPETWVWWEHNVSTYSPPGGVGERPEDPDEGASWTETYTVHSDTMVYDDGDITENSYSVPLTETYTYLGVKTITVPAGTFECEVIQTDDGDAIYTDWYCDDVGSWVKSAYESGSSESGTLVLTSFSYTPPDRTPPTVSITGPASGSHIRGDQPNITWHCYDNIGLSLVEVNIDSAGWFAWPMNYLPDLHLSSGEHTIQVRATDKAGNQASSSVTFTTDNRALSFGGPYYGLPMAAIIVGVILVGLFAAYTIEMRRRARAAPPPRPPPAPPSAP
jgi:hypothetical protein